MFKFLRQYLGKQLRLGVLPALGHVAGEAYAGRSDARADDVGQAHESSAQNEQDVLRVDVDKLLLRMLSSALRRNRGLGALDDFEQCLLHTLARHVARNGEVFGLAGDLVDFVDVDDADLRPVDIEVGRRGSA